ncbi:MAG: hypothetical protein DI533_00495 [Cereibacter sphaeroides]|uniref:Uncharacterized protein n=1 Tax=Cereibacter sphaeroides TaxID=1063 RepID=A0A2W5S840_CERSP|nr:MAG: hypothetical protein DI533_00495 [Cereibacter sphaeroides]
MTILKLHNTTTDVKSIVQDAIVPDFDVRGYASPGQAVVPYVGTRSGALNFVLTPAPSPLPGAFQAGGISVTDNPSPAGNSFAFQIFIAPAAGASPLQKVKYQLNLGSGYGSVQEMNWNGTGVFARTAPGSAPITITGCRAWVSNAQGDGPIYNVPLVGGSLTLSVLSVTSEAHLRNAEVYDHRQGLFDQHLIADMVEAFGENNYTGFTPAETVTFTQYTITHPNDLPAIWGAMNRDAKVSIKCDWDGYLSYTGTSNVFNGNALANGATDSGKVRAGHSIHMYAAPGKSPGINSTNWTGVQKMFCENIMFGNLNLNRSGCPVMAAFKGCTIGKSNGNTITADGGRVLHFDNCIFAWGKGLSSPPHYARYWNCVFINGYDAVDTFQNYYLTSSIAANWISRLWVFNCIFYDYQQNSGTSGVHFDFIQFGTGADVHKGYRCLFEFNFVYVDTPPTRPGCQGVFSGDVQAYQENGSCFHNNIMIFPGFKGVELKDSPDMGRTSVCGNFVMRSPRGIASADTGGGPVKIYAQDTAVTGTPGRKINIDNISTGTGGAGNCRDILIRNNQRCSIGAGSIGEAHWGFNIVKGNGGAYTLNAQGRPVYESMPRGLSPADARQWLSDFYEPIAGYRVDHYGVTHYSTWPSDPTQPLAAPAVPSLRRAPVTVLPANADSDASTDLGSWYNSDLIIRSWEICGDNAGAPDGIAEVYAQTPSVYLHPDLTGMWYRLKITNTNLTGTATHTSAWVKILPPLNLGTLFVEDFQRGGTPLTVGSGNFNTLVGAAGSAGAPLYDRTGSQISGSVAADVTSPTGRIVTFTSSGTSRAFYRQDVKAAMALGWTELEIILLHKTTTSARNECGIGYDHANGVTTQAATLMTGLSVTRDLNADTGRPRLPIIGKHYNGGGLIGPDNLPDNTVFYYKCRIVKNPDGTVTIKGKVWNPATEIEPVWTTKAAVIKDLSAMDACGFLSRGGSMAVQYMSIRVIP